MNLTEFVYNTSGSAQIRKMYAIVSKESLAVAAPISMLLKQVLIWF